MIILFSKKLTCAHGLLQGLGGGARAVQLPHHLQGPGAAVGQDVGHRAERRVRMQGEHHYLDRHSQEQEFTQRWPGQTLIVYSRHWQQD